MDRKRIKQIIKEELRRVLKEEAGEEGQSGPDPKKPNTDIDIGDRTESEKEEENIIGAAIEWGAQLTTVKYRQFLQDLIDHETNKALYSELQLTTSMILRQGSGFNDIRRAKKLTDIYNGLHGRRLSHILINSGYEYEPYQH